MHHRTAPGRPDHVLARVDPRIRLLCTALTIVLAISQNGLLFPTLVLLLNSGMICALGVRIRTYLLRLAEPFLISVVLVIIKALSGNDPLAVWALGTWQVAIFQDGLLSGCAVALRVLASVSALLLLAFSCSFTELLTTLAWYRVPRGLIELLLFAHRSLTAVHEEASTIYHAQRNRLGYASAGQGLRSFGMLAGTLVVRAFDQSQTTALAMVQRGYTGHLPVGTCRKLHVHDYAAVAIHAAALGVLWTVTSGI